MQRVLREAAAIDQNLSAPVWGGGGGGGTEKFNGCLKLGMAPFDESANGPTRQVGEFIEHAHATQSTSGNHPPPIKKKHNKANNHK